MDTTKGDSNVCLKKGIMKKTLFGAVKMFICTIGVLCIFGLLLGSINTASEKNMYSALGWGGILITGFIGTPIHEFSHYIMCKLFWVDVLEVNFFRPIQGKADGTLGYVSYAQEKGLFNKIGYFFIGFAPLIIGTLIIIILFKLLVPKAFKELNDEIVMIMSDDKLSINLVFRIVGEVIKNIFKIPLVEGGIVLAKYIFFMLLMFSISTHMILSSSDLQGAALGMIMILVLFIIVSLIMELIHFDYTKILLRITVIVSSFFGIAVVFSLISLGISYLFYMIFG